MQSGAFLDMLRQMSFWEVLDAGVKVSQQVVVPTTLLKPATNTIGDDFKRANEIYKPHGIEVQKGDHLEINEKATKALLGADESLDEFTDDSATAEELKLIEQNRTKGRITGYWIPGMTSSRGETIDSNLRNFKPTSWDMRSVSITSRAIRTT